MATATTTPAKLEVHHQVVIQLEEAVQLRVLLVLEPIQLTERSLEEEQVVPPELAAIQLVVVLVERPLEEELVKAQVEVGEEEEVAPQEDPLQPGGRRGALKAAAAATLAAT